MTQLPSGLHDPWMVVDAESQHVFVSSGVGGSVIDVLNLDGSFVTTITGESGASQMAVDPSTHTLYVALYSANSISEIDTHTLTETARFSTSPYANPYSLVLASGKLWFACLGGNGCVASANLDGTGVASAFQTYGSVLLSAGGSNNHLLATATYGVSPTGISLFDVSTGAATAVSGPQGDPEGRTPCDLGDFSVSPSGAHVLFASPCVSHAAALATDFSGSSYEYGSALTPNAVAWTPDGQYVAVGSPGGGGNPALVEVFPTTSDQPSWGWSLSALPHDLAFSPDGTQLYALVGLNGGVGFQVLDLFASPDTEITSGPASGSTTYSTWTSFDFSSHAAPVTFECNLDGSGWTACTSPQDFALPSGSHTFAVRSTLGTTTDPVGDSRTWTIQPPDTIITSGPSNPTFATSALFTFTSDAESTNFIDYTCKLDNQAWQPCWSPVGYSNLTAGSHTFQVKAQDDDVPSDVDPVGASQTWTIASQPEQLNVFTTGQGSGAVTSSPAGISCTSACATTFPSGTVVTLTATPAAGSVFDGWSGACFGTGSCVVTMTQARNVVATFSLPGKQQLTVTKSGKGTVSSVPSGITCGSTCSHSYSYGTPVRLKAVAASGFAFAGWSGACTGTSPTCQLTMTAARAATAKFARPKLLTVIKVGTGGGTVKSNPAGISCGSTCNHKFAVGTVVTLTATAKAGSTFAGWLGACTGTGSCTVTMSAAKKVKASFTR